jgi:hypothetical protein
MKSFKSKLLAIWFILTKRNFILLYGLKEIYKGDQVGSKVGVLGRTDLTAKRDFYCMCHAIKIAFPSIHLHVPEEIDAGFFDERGKYIGERR